jgi:TPR repeat protein
LIGKIFILNIKLISYVRFKKSAIQGYDKAQYRLGLCYHLEIGIERDLKEANYWFDF